MKRTIAISILSLFAAALFAQEPEQDRFIFIPGYDKEPDDEPVELFLPYGTVHSGRELPRTFTVSYPDEELALAGSLEPSLYIQPMDGAPTVTDTGAHNEYTWTYKMPFAWVGRLVMVYIGAADNPYTVLINGEQAGNNESSRSAAEFDVTSLSKEGLNTLTIQVEKAPAAAVLTSAPGLGTVTGEVIVHSQPRIRVRDYVAEAIFSSEEPTLQLGVILKTNMLNARMVKIHYSLTDRNGLTVASGHREAEVGLKEEDTVRFLTPAKALLPWTYESPQMYDLVIKNQYEGRYTEYVKYKLGFRNIRAHDGDLYTDGYRLPLAFYEMRETASSDMRAALTGIKQQGYNVVIAGAYPQDRRFYELCDSLGLYVCAQADINTSAAGESRKNGGNPSNDPRSAESFTDRAVTMHGTSASHPSALMFSIARSSSNGYNLYESYLAMKAREKTRPVIYPEGGGEWNSDAVTTQFARQYPEAIGERLVLDPLNPAKVYPDTAYAVMNHDGSGTCTITNNALVTPLKGTINYSIKKGMKRVADGSVPVSVEPGKQATLSIPIPDEVAGKKLKFEVSLTSNFD